jgi:hypothetical protein
MNDKGFKENAGGANNSNAANTPGRGSVTVTLSSETLDLIECMQTLDRVFDKVCSTLAAVYGSDQALLILEDGFIKKQIALRTIIEGYMMDSLKGDLYEGGAL